MLTGADLVRIERRQLGIGRITKPDTEPSDGAGCDAPFGHSPDDGCLHGPQTTRRAGALDALPALPLEQHPALEKATGTAGRFVPGFVPNGYKPGQLGSFGDNQTNPTRLPLEKQDLP